MWDKILSNANAHVGVNNPTAGHYVKQSSHTQPTGAVTNTPVAASHGKCEVSVHDNNSVETNDAMSIAHAIRATREPDVSVFKGDPLEYIEWNKSFARQVERNITYTDDDKLDYLRKFTGGEVSSIVSSFSTLDGNIAYAKVRAIIHERYGHPHSLYKAYLSRLRSWKKIATTDSASLQRFSDFLIALRTAMVSIPTLSCLNHQMMNDEI